MNCMLV